MNDTLPSWISQWLAVRERCVFRTCSSKGDLCSHLTVKSCVVANCAIYKRRYTVSNTANVTKPTGVLCSTTVVLSNSELLMSNKLDGESSISQALYKIMEKNSGEVKKMELSFYDQ